MPKINQFIKLCCFLLAIFILAVAVWYSPILFKGYGAYTMTANSLLARNIYQTDLYSAENDLNVLLSSNLLKDQGHLSAEGNKLTSTAYSKVFKMIGLPDVNNLILLSIIIHALTLLIFTGLILLLFDFKKASIFSLIYIFLPFSWQLPYHLGTYEFALLFLSLFFLFYLYGLKQKYSYIYLSLAGIFLALACLSAEALLLIIPFLLIYLYLKKQRRCLAYMFIPFIILFSVFWLPNLSHNAYMQMFFTETSQKVKSADFSVYGHLYPDPYTYHFEQKEFLDELQDKIANNRMALMKELDRLKELRNAGVAKISLIDRMRVGLVISSRHAFRFASLEDIGGPFILLLILLGLFSLKEKNRYLYQFFTGWILTTIFLMAFVVLVVRNHLMDFNWAIALLISLGLLVLSKAITDYFNLIGKKSFIVYLLILSVVLYNFILVNHVVWSRVYDTSNNLKVRAYSQEIGKMNILSKEVLVANLAQNEIYDLNYLTNKSIVYFSPTTIKKLLKEDKLNFAFDQFKAEYILGYPDQLSEEIIKQTGIINIASSSIEPAKPEISRNKGWFMNLIK